MKNALYYGIILHKEQMYESISFLFQCKMVVFITIPLKFEESHDGCMLKAQSHESRFRAIVWTLENLAL